MKPEYIIAAAMRIRDKFTSSDDAKNTVANTDTIINAARLFFNKISPDFTVFSDCYNIIIAIVECFYTMCRNDFPAIDNDI